jgi:hypothetical protein
VRRHLDLLPQSESSLRSELAQLRLVVQGAGSTASSSERGRLDIHGN